MRAFYDTNGTFGANTIYFIPTDDIVVLGVLNSALLDWYFRNQFQVLGDPWKDGRIRFFTQYMENIPIITEETPVRQAIEHTVQRVISHNSTENTAEIAKLEQKLDLLVYKLYNLSYHEILLIEPDFMLTEKEYETFDVER